MLLLKNQFDLVTYLENTPCMYQNDCQKTTSHIEILKHELHETEIERWILKKKYILVKKI